jgi:hypothetical protein
MPRRQPDLTAHVGYKKALVFVGTRTGILTSLGNIIVWVIDVNRQRRLMLEVSDLASTESLRNAISPAKMLENELRKVPVRRAGHDEKCRFVQKWNDVNFYTYDDVGYLRLMMEIGEFVPSRVLREAVKVGLTLRDALARTQGPFIRAGTNQYVLTILAEHKQGRSYAEIARWLNWTVARLLIGYARYLHNPETLDWYFGKSRAKPYGFEEAEFLLMAVRINRHEALIILSDGMSRLLQDKRPFDPGYPVSRDNIYELNRYWQAKSKPD